MKMIFRRSWFEYQGSEGVNSGEQKEHGGITKAGSEPFDFPILVSKFFAPVKGIRTMGSLGVHLLFFLFLLVSGERELGAAETPTEPDRPIYVIPIRDDIEESIVYVVRRGIFEAVEAKARAIVLDMNTNGGKGDCMEEIMDLIEGFEGKTITFVNKKAYSAGAFIAVATQHIVMAPSSVIGAAAPVVMSPEGGVEDLPSTMKKKMSSAFAAKIRAAASRNGHNPDLVDAMVRETDGLEMDGKTVVKKGDILTLTDVEATTLYGKPPKPLLADGVCKDLSEVLSRYQLSGAPVVYVEPKGLEKLARIITMIAPLLLLIGLAGLYIEFKTPGFGVAGIIGAIALAIFFFGHYIAGLAGSEVILLFLFGVVLVILELTILPGYILPGFIGAIAIVISLIWAMLDKVPNAPMIPNVSVLIYPMANLAIAMVGAGVLVIWVARWLPKSKGPLGKIILTKSLSESEGYVTSRDRSYLVGKRGVALSTLRPSGTARFGEEVVDVVTEGEFVNAKSEIIVKEVHGAQIVVEKVTTQEP